VGHDALSHAFAGVEEPPALVFPFRLIDNFVGLNLPENGAGWPSH
jgi:hypothetical protein